MEPTSARTRWTLGFQRRLVRLCEWLTFMPNDGFLPHTSQTAAISEHLVAYGPSPSEPSIGTHLGPSTPGEISTPNLEPADLSRPGQVSILAMRVLERLGAHDLVAVMGAYRDVLRSHQDHINRLNVYPVPDGDTGTNMALTVESVLQELKSLEDPDPAAVATAISHGSLMGARGNSGVILSQVLRGLVGPLIRQAGTEAKGMDAAAFVAGMAEATQGAYSAVAHPVEGTMLTVVREASEAARAREQSGLVEVLEAAREGAAKALERTPQMLPALKAAGVVDSGGSGLVLLMDSFLHVAAARALPEPPPSQGRPRSEPGEASRSHSGPRYEVMYLLEAPDELVGAFKEVWAGLGDSIVVVGGGGLWNCHIHTDEIGPAIEAALEAGRPRDIRVTDLAEQVEEERWVRQAEALGPPEAADEEPPTTTAVVAVSTGEGVRRIFRSLGVHHVVSGGQSMNPSTAELLAAVEAANSEQVVILPNNKNIIPVAQEAARAASKPTEVVPTRGIQEGFAALLEYDPQSDASSNAAIMTASASKVTAGEVVQAVRDSVCEVGPVAEGDWLGLSRAGVEVVAPDLLGAACGLLAKLIVPGSHEIVTVIAGEGSSGATTRRLTSWLEEAYPDLAVEVHQGGQPIYPYLFSVE